MKLQNTEMKANEHTQDNQLADALKADQLADLPVNAEQAEQVNAGRISGGDEMYRTQFGNNNW